ncbi:uncharacterized protein LOC130936052 [Arachis stenosperma]|uniref:uncharacterized protein LOC130936052 n=1 Tax=Arachis stenosperma TaxID=217475 RepID=UPI0025AD5BB2|nr:uncharacterized protein LOC130936052 [Arachis stenosperma]
MSGGSSDGDGESKSSPNKRLKTEEASEKVDGGGVDDNQGVWCGICYAERGAPVAGEIDCCSHYFCFACIMEWSKHESRCPICRRRFSNVRRLPKHGIFSSSRDIKVPLRDQVYHPYGNMSTGPTHSHTDANCVVCHGVADEHLLLICDLCDASSHTYCVGLGYTVPEGDWFCYDCAIARETNEREDLELQNVEQSGAISAIPCPLQQSRSPPPPSIPSADRLSRYRGKRPLSNAQQVQRNIQALRDNWNALRSGSMKFGSGSIQTSGIGGCHNRDSGSASCGRPDKQHSNSMGLGSLGSSSGSVSRSRSDEQHSNSMVLANRCSGSVLHGRSDEQHSNSMVLANRCSGSVLHGRSDEQHSNSMALANRGSGSILRGGPHEQHFDCMASPRIQHSSVQDGSSRGIMNERGMKDVEKAWKMMEKAKKMQGTRQRTNRK